jgi:hypothetical protein
LLSGDHLEAIGDATGVLRARTFKALREELPIPYYASIGNRGLVAELDPELFSVLRSADFREELAASLHWELELPYVRRDVYRCVAYATATST